MNRDKFVSVVIPAYNEEKHISNVINGIPKFVDLIIVVDDCSNDKTIAEVKKSTKINNIVILENSFNKGVGGSFMDGLKLALEKGSDIIVKVDGDNQMRLDYMKNLIEPLIDMTADYTKGNRFFDFEYIQQMPFVRRIGNMALSFLSKIASGYWDLFDPTNGFIAITKEAAIRICYKRIDNRFFFEQSLLHELYLIDAVVRDVNIPAKYGDEESKLSILHTVINFPSKIIRGLVRRIWLKKFVFNFSIDAIYILLGSLMVFGGSTYGLANWIKYATIGVGAPTGKVVIPSMLIILGVQFLISAIQMDIVSVPKIPIKKKLEKK